MSNPDQKDVVVTLKTKRGEIRLKLFVEDTPYTCANFINLAWRGYYDGKTFHRVIGDFMIHGGCPQGTGTGGPGYTFQDEFVKGLRHDKPGILSMANAGPKTNGSQFFVTHIATPWLDGKHTVFGAVLDASDMKTVNQITQGDLIESATVTGAYDAVLEKLKATLDDWNQTLDANFKNLKPRVEVSNSTKA